MNGISLEVPSSRLSSRPMSLKIYKRLLWNKAPDAKNKKYSIFFRKLLFRSSLFVSIFYAAGIYISRKNEFARDTFSQYVPLGESLLIIADEWASRQRVYQHDARNRKVIVQPNVERNIIDRSQPRQIEYSEADDTVQQSADKSITEVTNQTNFQDSEQTLKNLESEVVILNPPKLESGDEAVLLPSLDLNGDMDPVVIEAAEFANKLISGFNKLSTDENDVRNLQQALEKISAKFIEIHKEFEQKLDMRLHEQASRFEELTSAQLQDMSERLMSEKKQLLEIYNQRLTAEVKLAKEAILARANNALLNQYISQEEKFARTVKFLVDQEHEGRLADLHELSKDLSQLKDILLLSNNAIQDNDRVVKYYSAVTALQAVLSREASPLRSFISRIEQSLPDDPLVRIAVSVIPQDVLTHGVLSVPQLAARFDLIVPEIRRASLAPPNAGIAGHLTSLVASKLLVEKSGMPRGDDTESIIARAETLLSQGRVIDAVAEVNSLQGWAKEVAHDWLVEARKRGELEFIIEVLANEGYLWSITKH